MPDYPTVPPDRLPQPGTPGIPVAPPPLPATPQPGTGYPSPQAPYAPPAWPPSRGR